MSNNWQPIETAPKDGTAILLLSQLGVVSGRYYFKDGEQRYWQSEMGDVYFWGATSGAAITHWMPLPAPPQEGE